VGTTFTFSPEEFDGVVREWEDLEDDIAAARTQFEGLGKLAHQRPADDIPSRTFMGQAQTAISNAEVSNMAVAEYVRYVIDKLNETKGSYVRTDTGNAEAITVSI